MDKIDELSYNLYVSTQINLHKEIWTDRKNFVEHKNIYSEYYKESIILLRKDKINKILNKINESNR